MPTATDAPPRELIDAALACVELYGGRRTSPADVAAMAGVSRSTIHRQLGSKPEMVLAVAKAEIERFFAAMEGVVPEGTALDRALPIALGFALDWFESHRPLQRVLREEPDELIDVIFERGDLKPISLIAAHVAEILSESLEAAQLGIPSFEAAEWMTRALFSLTLVPSSSFRDPEKLSRLILGGLTG